MTLTGRRRLLPDIRSAQPASRAYAERQVCLCVVRRRMASALTSTGGCGGHRHLQAVNTVIQGTAADIIKLAMINLQRECASSLDDPAATRVLLQIHDELLLECPNDAPTIKSCVLVTLHCLEGGAALSLWRGGHAALVPVSWPLQPV